MSTTATTTITAEPGSHALDMTREFAAPAELVFRAHTDPDLLARWMGPRRLTMSVPTWECRDGGRWRFVNHDTDGTEYGFHGVFHGTPSLADGVVWTFEFEGTPGHVSLERLTFTEADGRTTLHAHTVFQTVEARDGMIASGMETGVDEGYEKLDELLASLGTTA